MCKHQGGSRELTRTWAGEHEMGFNLITNLSSREASCGLPGALDGRDKSPVVECRLRRIKGRSWQVMILCCFAVV